MTERRPLPPIIRRGHLTRAQARQHDVPDERLQRSDLRRVAYGLYRSELFPEVPWAFLGLPDPAHGLDAATLAELAGLCGGFVSHSSAAHLYGVPLPAELSRDPQVHLTGPDQRQRVQRSGVVGHRRPLPEHHRSARFDVPVVSPERVWLDLASQMGTHQVTDLVAAGDSLVHSPWVQGARRTPLTTPSRLAQELSSMGTFKGVRLARAALGLVRIGADSFPETALRLALVNAGLPEPHLQVSPSPAAAFTADLAYPQWKIAFQYDGEHHRSAEQQTTDARRDAWFQSHGWRVIRVTHEDLRNGFLRVIGLVHHLASSPIISTSG